MNTRGVKRTASPVCQPALDVTQCAICLQTNDAASEVQLPCKHKFHGTCIVRHLLHDPRGRCPMCRWEPPRKKQHVDSQAHDDMWKEFEDFVHERLHKLKTPTLKMAMKDFDMEEAEEDMTHEDSVDLVLEQLTNETDDDESDDDE